MAAVLCAAVTACSKTGGGTGANGRVNAFTVPHVLRYTTAPDDVTTLNPHLGQQQTLLLLSQLTMAWLIRFDEHNNAYPELATQVPTQQNGGVSKDGLTITYHLRKGVKWSDGAPFTADDVVFSTKVVLNPVNDEVGRLGWNLIAKIDEPDKYTVVYHLSKPYSPFVETFFATGGANPCILPKHLLDRYPNINHVPYNSLPVGIGPFKYKEWIRASKVVMVANPLYWRGMPKLKEIDWVVIPDRNTALAQLQAKAVDMWYPVPGAYYPRVQQLAPYTTLRLPSYLFNHLDFNLTSPALKDLAVRRALRLAIDRKTIITKIGHGVGYLNEQPAARTAPYYDPKIALVPFDIAQANAILDGAGWVRGPDGVRSKNGVKLALNFATTTGSPDADQQIELIRSWWSQLGVAISVKRYPLDLLLAPAEEGGIVYAGKFDVVVFAWGMDPIGDLSSEYGCASIPPNGQNDPRWCNKRANDAMLSLYAHYNQAQRNADDAIVQEEIVKDVPIVVLSGREDIWATNRDLKNFHPNAVSPFDNMMQVDI
jgi:peptide/nickel transport system substrate-binding protein